MRGRVCKAEGASQNVQDRMYKTERRNVRRCVGLQRDGGSLIEALHVRRMGLLIESTVFDTRPETLAEKLERLEILPVRDSLGQRLSRPETLTVRDSPG